ncbi:AAA family ATPase [Xenorhabdus griffiniae]|uniref:AAA family ATPase n=1 Tax=Xenorhabdus griffiniae TaxID=351672 RepID=A0ABY9XEF8_9GAMM|nr:AAA family ATPase [Xenorhabdus griffiniae]MBD1229471.1 AAA family ATPase [Xenorhabdus griffiniae]MBE8589288.1 AAA family ATPase [Xenorhabdus griffiniae]WMV71274.1 AAA family ATPase [Xenorhabdus griffiniae]WNH00950.1 AAA family ATPase [Xenorhabdus griffiniae]
MGTATLILGESGTGKSTSLRNLNPEETLLIQTVRKPLPFRSAAWKQWNKNDAATSVFVTDNWQHIIRAIESADNYGKKIIVIDDFQYLMANEFMRRSEEKSFDKFTEIGSHTWNVINTAISKTPDDLRVYFLSHTEETQMGKIKMKTIGKMLDEKITVEGMFTIVLKTAVRDGQYLFTTQNNGFDTVKSPMGLFDSSEIENDLKAVDDAICEYYGIATHTTDEAAA